MTGAAEPTCAWTAPSQGGWIFHELSEKGIGAGWMGILVGSGAWLGPWMAGVRFRWSWLSTALTLAHVSSLQAFDRLSFWQVYCSVRKWLRMTLQRS